MTWLKSKTMWLQVAVALTGIQAVLPDFQMLISPEAYGYILLFFAVVGAIIRAYTTKPLAEK